MLQDFNRKIKTSDVLSFTLMYNKKSCLYDKPKLKLTMFSCETIMHNITIGKGFLIKSTKRILHDSLDIYYCRFIISHEYDETATIS